MAVRAEDDCTLPMVDWQPRQAVRTHAETQGWTIRRIKIDDGCYEIDGWDSDGRPFEIKLDPGTLAVVDVEYETDDTRSPKARRPERD